jgi:GTP pyrophosphokinase
MFLAAGRGELGPRAISVALRGEAPAPTEPPATARARSKSPDGGVLVEGVGKLLTTLGNCCKPVPPDLIGGFVTRGRGVSIHRPDCLAFQKMAQRHPERLITAQWGSPPLGERRAYAVDIRVEAADRQGLLRDISDVLSREKINVTAVNTMSKNHRAFMGFTIEVSGLDQLQRALTLIAEVPSVAIVRRG